MPERARKKYDTSTYDEVHSLLRRRRFAKKVSRATLKTRLVATQSLGRTRAQGTQDGLPDVARKRNRGDKLHLAVALDKRDAPPMMGPELEEADTAPRERRIRAPRQLGSYEMRLPGRGRRGIFSVDG